MRERPNDSSTLTTSFFIGGSLLLTLFLLFSWGNSLLKHANINRQIGNFHLDNERIELENITLSEQLKYLESPQYRDKWAKQHKGLAQPGEEVLVIEFKPHSIDDDAAGNEILLEHELLLSQPNREQWKVLFFGKR